jgi:homoserine dehydrogenase
MRIILIGYGVVGKSVTTILARKYAEKVKAYGFNPKIVAIADIDGAVLNPRGLSPDKLEAIKQRGYPISADPEFGRPGIKEKNEASRQAGNLQLPSSLRLLPVKDFWEGSKRP